jgi:hypothetical protein
MLLINDNSIYEFIFIIPNIKRYFFKKDGMTIAIPLLSLSVVVIG